MSSKVKFVSSFYIEEKKNRNYDSFFKMLEIIIEDSCQRPVIIYGFDRFDYIKDRFGFNLFENSNIFYLQLPSSVTNIKIFLKKAE